MKTAVSIPDELFARAERLARMLDRPRSQLYADALREYVERHDPASILEALARVYGPADSELDSDLAAAAQKLLENVEWE